MTDAQWKQKNPRSPWSFFWQNSFQDSTRSRTNTWEEHKNCRLLQFWNCLDNFRTSFLVTWVACFFIISGAIKEFWLCTRSVSSIWWDQFHEIKIYSDITDRFSQFSRPTDLKSLGLVSKKISALSITLLYRDLILPYDPEGPERLWLCLTRLSQSISLEHVQTIRVGLRSHMKYGVQRYCTSYAAGLHINCLCTS